MCVYVYILCVLKPGLADGRNDTCKHINSHINTHIQYLRLIERDIPLDVDEIEGDYLRDHIRKNGCCGATELLKLYAWLLTDYHRVVHLDMDSMVLQSLDELYDMEDKDLIYTCDYGMMTKGSKACPVQGGFFVLRPNQEDFDGLVAVMKKGDFREGSAWGGENIGWYWGGMTIQGRWVGVQCVK